MSPTDAKAMALYCAARGITLEYGEWLAQVDTDAKIALDKIVQALTEARAGNLYEG